MFTIVRTFVLALVGTHVLSGYAIEGEGEPKPPATAGEKKPAEAAPLLQIRGPQPKHIRYANLDESSVRIAEKETVDAGKDYYITKETKITIDGKPATLKDLREKMAAFIEVAKDDKTLIELRIEGPILRGKIISWDEGAGKVRMVVYASDGAHEYDYEPAPDYIAHLQGEPVKLSEIPTGMIIAVQLSSDRSKLLKVDARGRVPVPAKGKKEE